MSSYSSIRLSLKNVDNKEFDSAYNNIEVDNPQGIEMVRDTLKK